VENGVVTVEDLGSSNGTKVGDRRSQRKPADDAPRTGTPLRFRQRRVTLEIL